MPTDADAPCAAAASSAARRAPTWTRDVDVVVLGSGAAGLSAALAARPVRTRADRHQGHPRRRQHGVGAGRARRRARPARLAREPRARHARRRRRAVRRGRRAHARRRGAEGDPLPDAARRGVRPGARRRGSGADPRGRAQPQPHRPLRRRPERRRGAAHARRERGRRPGSR